MRNRATRYWRQKRRYPCIKMPNESLERISLNSLCVKLIAFIKHIWLNSDEAEKHLHINKFMRIENIMSNFLKLMKGRASGLLKIAYKT